MKKPKTLTVAVSACLALGSLFGADVQVARAATFVMEFGKQDNFDLSDFPPDEMPTPRTELTNNFYAGFPKCTQNPIPSNWVSRCQLRKFDERHQDRNFMHSFDLSSALASGEIVSATLETKLEAIGGYNDGFLLGLVSHGQGNYWYGRIGQNNYNLGIPSLTPTWTYGQVEDFNLDLSNLPSLTAQKGNLLPMLNEVGFLDIEIQDDTVVDYLKLTVKTVPEPGTVAGLAVLGFGFVASKTRKFFGRR
ncbi:MAG: PEP-CTERM sorting domain-containing protein [Cyanobacteriota bacterium]|nr:PEP-CTERM sorting domain-containing protein [Cyanobacteriota bacterium]